MVLAGAHGVEDYKAYSLYICAIREVCNYSEITRYLANRIFDLLFAVLNHVKSENQQAMNP